MNLTYIRASAGTGKTYRLTQSISERLVGTPPQLKPDQVIATTFTVKAAGELRGEIQKKLLEDQAVEAAAGVRTALIGTVNSVAGQLVADNAVFLGLSPDVRVLDEGESARLLQQALDVATMTAEDSQTEAMLARLKYLGDPTSEYRGSGPHMRHWANAVEEIVHAALGNDLDAHYLRTSARQKSWETLAKALPSTKGDHRLAWAAWIEDALPPVNASSEPPAGKDGLESRTQIDTREDRAIARDFAQTAAANPDAIAWNDWLRMRVVKGDYRKTVNEELRDAQERIVDAILSNQQLHDDLKNLIDLVFDVAAKTLEQYEELKARAHSMDFADQERYALRLLNKHGDAATDFKQRYDLLAVDEFQDTSPVQLALFTAMSRLITEVIWVGDSKQTIYSFRGADPRLVQAVEQAVEQAVREEAQSHPGGGTGERKVRLCALTESWRSNKPVLEFANEVSSWLFPKEDVRLTIPKKRPGEQNVGAVEFWNVRPEKGMLTSVKRAEAVAQGVVDLRNRHPREDGKPYPLHEIAVLTRGNARAAQISAALSARGLPTTLAHLPVATIEGRMVRNGLALVADPSDSLALTELIQAMPDHPAHRTWFTTLADTVASGKPNAVYDVFRGWWEGNPFEALRKVRCAAPQLAPVELTEAVITALGMPERVRGWTGESPRFSTLEAMLASAGEFQQLPGLANAAALVDFFDTQTEAPQGAAPEGAIFVGTIHKAKGLDWEVVVTELGEPPNPEDLNFNDGVFVYTHIDGRPEGQVDVEDPLAGRQIRWLPWLPRLKGKRADAPETQLDAAQEKLREVPFIKAHTANDIDESKRVLYVSLTRAKKVMAMFYAAKTKAAAENESGLLRSLLHVPPPGQGKESVTLKVEKKAESANPEPGSVTITVAKDDSADGAPAPQQPVELRYDRFHYEVSEPTATEQAPPPATVAGALEAPVADAGGSPQTAPQPRKHRPARIAASGAVASGPVKVTRLDTLGEAIPVEGGDAAQVGEAVHGFLSGGLSSESEAEVVLANWFPHGKAPLTAQSLVKVGTRWSTWLKDQQPDAKVVNEMPVRWRNSKNQVLTGWVDTLVETPDGNLLIIDHKTYHGDDPEGFICEQVAGQLLQYQRALKAAAGKTAELLVHLPLLGDVYRVDPIHADGATDLQDCRRSLAD